MWIDGHTYLLARIEKGRLLEAASAEHGSGEIRALMPGKVLRVDVKVGTHYNYGEASTQGWTAGELVRDRHSLALPADLRPGAYRLVVGLYRASDRSRFKDSTGLFTSRDYYAIKTLVVKR